MTTTSVPSKMKTIDNAIGFNEFRNQLSQFMGVNNLPGEEIILHVLNSFYFMSPDLSKVFKNDNDTPKNQEASESA